jgi:hypothetical protein
LNIDMSHDLSPGNDDACPKAGTAKAICRDQRRAQLPNLRIDYGWLAPSVSRLCRLEPDLVAFVRGAPSHTKHFIGLAITGALKHPHFPEAVLAAALASTPRRDLLARLWGKDLGSTRALMRLDRQVCERRTYEALAAILADPERRNAYGDLPRPTERAILRIAHVPQAILAQFRGRLIGAFGGNGLPYIVEGVGRVRPDLTPAAIRQTLNRLENPQRIDHLMMRLTRDVDLPAVPWSGTADIIPLTTVPALRATGLRLENCLNSLSIWCEALRGVRAFYLVEVDELCVAALARHPLFGTWYLQSIAKRRNGAPSQETNARIVDAFAAAGFPHFDGDPIGIGLNGAP